MSFTKVKIFMNLTAAESLDVAPRSQADHEAFLEQSAQLTDEEELFRWPNQSDR
jgi:hypothetical protein